ncbi:GNAT family N-acetyltransferase [Ferdinandcohnia sp. SAFN-114]|uniref:GNAT family N-acetyltransferase n=1 Tax=Ferdinandcohnia sp. SAFN-114 TaxID=3387275 RepID=UPI003F7F6B34
MLDVRIIEPEMTYILRHTVLRPNQSIEDSKYATDHKKDAFHVGAFFQGKLISVASFVIEKNPGFAIERQYRLRQMATLEEYRKLGAGRAVVSFAENIIKERGFDFLWCKGRTTVQKYYE